MSKKEKIKEYKIELNKIFLKAGSDTKLMLEFLQDMMTPSEFDKLAIRWQIVKRLNNGETHREIAGDLGIGISTVTRGARELRNKKGGFALMLDKMK